MCISVIEASYMSAAQGIPLFFLLEVLAQQSSKSSRNELGYDDPHESRSDFLTFITSKVFETPGPWHLEVAPMKPWEFFGRSLVVRRPVASWSVRVFPLPAH